MASQNSGPLDWLQCALLSDHKKGCLVRPITQSLGRHCQEVDLRATVGSEMPGRLGAPSQPKEREHKGGHCIRGAAPRPLEMTESGQGAA